MHSFHNTEANSIPKNNSLKKKSSKRTPYFSVCAVAPAGIIRLLQKLWDNITTEKHTRRKMVHFLVRSKLPTTSAETANNPPLKEKRKKLSADSIMKVMSYGFSWTRDVKSPQPQCVLCQEKLANANMVPSKLKRHLETKHPFYFERNLAFFKRARDLNQWQQDRLLDCVKVSEKAMEASYNPNPAAKYPKCHHLIIKSKEELTTCQKTVSNI